MASFPFSVSISSSPALEVSGVNISYEELLNSFGAYFYLLEKMFIRAFANNDEQVNQPLQFTRYNLNGSENSLVFNPCLDPYGRQSALLQDFTGRNILLDGQTILAVDILAGASLRYTLFTKRNYLSNGLLGGRPKDKMPNV
jgi:hypothetical protein